MKAAAFAYAKARSLDHALELLGQGGGEAKILAGGQSLMPTLNMRLSHPKLLIDINGVPGLDDIALEGDMLSIGALVRQSAAERSPEIARHTPLIAEALRHIAHPAIRNRGTIGGSIAFADPAAELPACLLALGGDVEIAGKKGCRRVKADDFFRDIYETAIGPGDVLLSIRVPVAGDGRRHGFAELARRHGDYAMAGLAAGARANGAGLTDVRLAFFGVGLTPVRARGAEAALEAGRIDDAVAALAQDLDPPDDVQASGTYKRHAAGVLLRQVAAQLAGRS